MWTVAKGKKMIPRWRKDADCVRLLCERIHDRNSCILKVTAGKLTKAAGKCVNNKSCYRKVDIIIQ